MYIVKLAQRLVQSFDDFLALILSRLYSMQIKIAVEFISDDSVMFEMIHSFESSVRIIVLIFA